jgi:hypothetical protein
MKKYMIYDSTREYGLVDSLLEARHTKKWLKSIGKEKPGFFEWDYYE